MPTIKGRGSLYVPSLSKAGSISEKKEALNITPAANPVNIFVTLGENSFFDKRKQQQNLGY